MTEILRISVTIKPNKNKVKIELEKNILKIHLTSPPTGGKANKELIEILSKKLRIPKSDITILKGITHPSKILSIKNCEQNYLMLKLKPSEAL